MTVDELAGVVVDACQSEGIKHMLTGAFAFSYYGIPRATKDVDVVLSLEGGNPVGKVAQKLEPLIEFDQQVQFDTLTWGRRLVGTTRDNPPFKVELFEFFEDRFVLEQFARRVRLFVPQLARETWLPTPEDVVVQKLRWG